MFDLIDRTPQVTTETMLWELGDLLEEWASGTESVQVRVIGKVAQLINVAATLPFDAEGDLLTAALSRPIGKLALATLDVLVARDAARNSGLSVDLVAPLTAMTQHQGASASLGRVMITSRLAVLHDIDPSWTEAQLVPRFDWAVASEAKAAWQGYMWSPWVRPSLWQKLKSFALDTLGHLGELDKYREHFVRFMVSLSFDTNEALSLAETQKLLRRLDPEDLATAANWLEWRVADAAKTDPSWAVFENWFSKAWPKELGAVTPKVSDALARIPVLVPDRFERAVALVSKRIGPATHGVEWILRGVENGLDVQHPESTIALLDQNQARELRAYAEARGWVVTEFVDQISGVKESRPALDRLQLAARRRQFDVILVWNLSRLGRSLGHLIRLVENWQALGISLVSFRDGPDLSTPSGRLQMPVSGALATFERERLRERVVCGLARDRAQGKRLGRPRNARPAIAVPGGSVREAARIWGVSKSTAARWIVAGTLWITRSEAECDRP